MKFLDSHAHISSSDIKDPDSLVLRAKEKGVEEIINICTDSATLQLGLQLTKKWKGVFNTAALTPHDVMKEEKGYYELLASHARKKDLVAIGETGLDYYYKELDPDRQKDSLIRHLKLAQECGLPVIFHCREAFNALFEVCDEHYSGKALCHCFTGTKEEAEEVFKRGWLLSFSGIVTFKKSEPLREVAKLASLHQIVIETDTPYLAPESKRGKVNEPSYLPEIAETIARAKNLSLEDVAKATRENALRFFNL